MALKLKSGVYHIQPLTNPDLLLHSWSGSGGDGATLRLAFRGTSKEIYKMLVTHRVGDKYHIQFTRFPDAHLHPNRGLTTHGNESFVFTTHDPFEWTVTPAGPGVWRVSIPNECVWSFDGDDTQANNQVKARPALGTPSEQWLFNLQDDQGDQQTTAAVSGSYKSSFIGPATVACWLLATVITAAATVRLGRGHL